MGDQPAFDFGDGGDSVGGAVEAPQPSLDPEEFLIPGRLQHPFPEEGNNRTCYFCHRLCYEVNERFYYTDEKAHFCICHEHRNFVGTHGELADPNRKPRDAGSVARYLRTSTSPHLKRRGRKADKPKPITVNPGDELGDGEVTPEVAAFLRSKGLL